MGDTLEPRKQRHSTVSPLLVWLGVVLTLAGIIGTGLGLARDNAFWLLWISVAVTVVGILLTWRGGAMYDVHGASKSVGAELVEAAHGQTHKGVAPSDRLTSEAVRARAVEANQLHDRLIAERTGGPMAPMYPIGTLFLMLAGIWLIIGQFALPYSHSDVGYNGDLRDMGIGLVVLLSALWLRHVGASRVASLLALACGIGLILFGMFLPHHISAIAVDEIFAGAWVLLATAATFEGAHQEARR